VNVAEDELGDVAGHVRRDAGDIIEGLFADIAHHLFQLVASAMVSLIVSPIVSVIIRHERSFG
jgi:hypothetical protein